MNKRLFAVLGVLLCLSLCGCMRAEKVEGEVSVPEFTVRIDGKEYTESDFSALEVYKCSATSENRYGTEVTYEYTGYQLSDVLRVAHVSVSDGVTIVCSDGYEVDLTQKETLAGTTLLAFYRDGSESAEDGTVFVVPCKSDSSPDYAKVVTEIVVK